jgi:hypothetical protein
VIGSRVLRGPSILVIPGSFGLALPAASSLGSPSSSVELVYRFRASRFVRAVLLVGRPDLGMPDPVKQSGQLSILIVDQNQQPIVSDSRAIPRGSNLLQPAAPALALQGTAFRPFELQRIVKGNDAWRFTVQNEDPINATTLAALCLYFDDGAA